jgi:hypothetical protein
MAFWSDPYTMHEPKRVYRWILNIGGIPQWLVKKVNKPSFEVSKAEHQYLNHTFYYPGRVTYDPVSVTLVDPVSPDATFTVMEMLRHSGYEIPDDPNDLMTISKKFATRAVGDINISQIDPAGTIIDQFSLVNAWLEKSNFGELNYTDDNLVDIELTFAYDFAVMGRHGEAVEGLPFGAAGTGP